ncbi:MAG: tetratricopeptide repeat protein [Bacteroidota bacterium]
MYRFFVSIILFAFLFSGCGSVFQSTDSKDEAKADTVEIEELSQEEQLRYQYSLVEGLKQKALKNYSHAISYFYKCLEIQPNSPAVQYQVSLVNNLLEQPDLALQYGKKAVENAPENKYYREHLFQLYLRNEQPKEAIKQYEYLVENKQAKTEHFYDLAQLYRETNQYNKAIEMLNKVEKRTGINEQIQVLKKALYTKTGNEEKAIAEVKKLIDNFPKETRYYGMLAELYASYQMYDKADKMYDRLFEIDSTNYMGQVSLVEYYKSQGKYDEALNQYELIIDHDKIDFGTKFLVFMKFLEDRNVYLQNNDKMILLLDSLSSFYPDKDEVHTLYTDLYLKTNKYDKAIDHLEVLVKSENERPVFWEQLLSLYSYNNEFEKMYKYGVKSLEQYTDKSRLFLFTAIGANQTNRSDTAATILKEGLETVESDEDMKIQYYTQLGEAYKNLNKHENSDKYFEKVLEMDPENLLVSNNYSYYLSLRGEKLERARELIENAIQQEPNSAIYLDTYAWVLYKLEKYDKAEKHIEKAIRNGGSEDHEVLEHYGDILFKNGKEDKALQQWKKSKSAGNDSDEIEYKIENQKIPE